MISFLILFTPLISGFSLAAEKKTVPTESASTDWFLNVGIGVTGFDYREKVDAPKKSTEYAFLPTFFGEIQTVPESSGTPFFLGHLDLAVGNTTYDGSTQGSATEPPVPVTSTTANAIWNVDANIGIGFLDSDAADGMTYVGLGYHYWVRDLSRDKGGYREDYTWWYAQWGFFFDFSVSEQTSIGIDGSAKYLFGGNTKAYLSEIMAGVSDVDLPLGTSFGFRLKTPISFSLTDTTLITTTPFYEFYTLKESPFVPLLKTNGAETGTFVKEPSSTTRMYGLLVGVLFVL